VWHDVLEKSNLARNTVFSTHQIYPDAIIGDIATACAELTGYGSTKNDFFEFFGRCFVR
jgi:guanylate cyclase